MRIGILGGTFNPIHEGHLMIARCAREQFRLDEVWFMPNSNPPHKDVAFTSASTQDRACMVRLAIEGEAAFRLEPYELERTKTNYTYHTMEHFKKKYPEHSFFFIVGGDSLFAFHTWKHPERIASTCTILAAVRDGKGYQETEACATKLSQTYNGKFCLIKSPDFPVSSSEIRDCISRGEDVTGMVPSKVESYIEEHKLYH